MKYITNFKNADGFGSQYQRIIECYIYSKYNKYIFHYRPFSSMEHNYTNDPLYIEKKEKLINLISNIDNIDNNKLNNYIILPNNTIIDFFEKNINEICEGEHIKFIKDCFWKNKEKNVFKNAKINIAVHIRRLNSHDGGIRNAGDRVTTNNKYYLDIINIIKKKYQNKELCFHIHSQGKYEDFSEFYNQENIILKLNTEVEISFIEMVAADILITSPSGLSYVAALLSDGEIWYKPFWHPPRKNWIIC
jgi:hypothetical protein